VATPVLHLALSGEIDLRRGGELRRIADAYDRGDVPCVHVDLADVTFLDSTGLAFLARLVRTATSRGGEVVVSGPQPIVRRVLQASGLLEILRVEP
jgi:anti-sigma B factor antagonist